MQTRFRLYSLGLIVSSLAGYLEWSKDNRMFIYQMELEVFSKFLTQPSSVIHPFVVLPLIGQLILLFNACRKKPSRALTLIGMATLGLLLFFMLLIGMLSTNLRIFAAAVPFALVSVYTIWSVGLRAASADTTSPQA